MSAAKFLLSLGLTLVLALPARATEGPAPDDSERVKKAWENADARVQVVKENADARVKAAKEAGKLEERKKDLRYLTKEEVKSYRIQPADVFALDVYNEAELNRTVQVDRNGFINYPLIGRVKVEGLVQEEVETKIRALLEKDYLVSALVTMRFVKEQDQPPSVAKEKEKALRVSYIILGEVRRPGTYEFNPAKGKMTLLKAISIAGGFSDIANMSKIKLLHRAGESTRSLTINVKDIINGKRPDEEIKSDDLIVVPESLL